MKVQIDAETPQAHGVCEGICPEVFALKGGKAEVEADYVPEGAEEACREAARSCPTGAILVGD